MKLCIVAARRSEEVASSWSKMVTESCWTLDSRSTSNSKAQPCQRSMACKRGRKTLSIMRAAQPFVPGGWAPERAVVYRDRKPFHIGHFKVTPYLMDHSGFDAYSFLIETGGKRLLYSGDIRGHGRKVALFERFVANPPNSVDVMLMEGSSLGRLSEGARFETEGQIENRLLDAMSQSTGMVLVACSVQNIVVSVYRAAKRSGRQLIVDAYGAEVLRATDTASIPKPAEGWGDVKVYIPKYQRRHLAQNEISYLVDGYKDYGYSRRSYRRQRAGR